MSRLLVQSFFFLGLFLAGRSCGSKSSCSDLAIKTNFLRQATAQKISSSTLHCDVSLQNYGELKCMPRFNFLVVLSFPFLSIITEFSVSSFFLGVWLFLEMFYFFKWPFTSSNRLTTLIQKQSFMQASSLCNQS